MPKRSKSPAVIVPPAPSSPKPMPHADSPTVAASSVEYATAEGWRCPSDGQRNQGARCTTCGATK